MMRVLAWLPGLIFSLNMAWAAEPIFPPASRVGLVPPDGMVLAKHFTGFAFLARVTGISIEHVKASPSRHEVVAKGMLSGEPVIKTQTFIFGSDFMLVAVGIAPSDQRDNILPRFHRVIDSVEMKP